MVEIFVKLEVREEWAYSAKGFIGVETEVGGIVPNISVSKIRGNGCEEFEEGMLVNGLDIGKVM